MMLEDMSTDEQIKFHKKVITELGVALDNMSDLLREYEDEEASIALMRLKVRDHDETMRMTQSLIDGLIARIEVRHEKLLDLGEYSG